MAEGHRIASNMKRQVRLSPTLDELHPLASHVAEAAAMFTLEDFADLTELAAGDPTELARSSSTGGP